MSVTTTTTQRYRHTDLKPLNTLIDSSRRKSPLSTHSTRSAILPSPSIVAARAYFLEAAISTPISQNGYAYSQNGNLLPPYEECPRRHSALPSLSTQLNNFSFAPHPLLSAVPNEELIPTSPTAIKLEYPPSSRKPSDALTSHSTSTPRRRSSQLVCGTPQEVLRQVPFEYTHQHLRDWGYAYLGNSSTADAFINAIPLRRTSFVALKDKTSGEREEEEMVTIRARIVPRQKERRPFVIQRKFDIEGLREGFPVPPTSTMVKGGGYSPGGGRRERAMIKLRRSSRIRRRRADGYYFDETRENVKNRNQNQNQLRNGKRFYIIQRGGFVPIHIEYALHYLPVLAALMLSGHVRKGDGIDLPLPFPECWEEVVEFIYTGWGVGGGVLSEGAREDLLFLGGRL